MVEKANQGGSRRFTSGEWLKSKSDNWGSNTWNLEHEKVIWRARGDSPNELDEPELYRWMRCILGFLAKFWEILNNTKREIRSRTKREREREVGGGGCLETLVLKFIFGENTWPFWRTLSSFLEFSTLLFDKLKLNPKWVYLEFLNFLLPMAAFMEDIFYLIFVMGGKNPNIVGCNLWGLV